jgi:hypothetical protein
MHTINAGQRTVGLLALMLIGLLTHKQVSAASKTFYMDEGIHYSDISMCVRRMTANPWSVASSS